MGVAAPICGWFGLDFAVLAVVLVTLVANAASEGGLDGFRW